MEAKDWLTLFTSWAALGVAGYSLWLTKVRDRREETSRAPRIDFIPSECEGRGPWSVRYEIENRSDAPLEVEGLALDYPRKVRFYGGPSENHFTLLSERSRTVKMVGWKIGETVAPQCTMHGSFEIEPHDGKRLPGPIKVDFYVLATVRDRDAIPQRLRARRIVSP